MDLLFQIVDKADPRCRQKKLKLKTYKKPMMFQTTNCSFGETFENFTKLSEKETTLNRTSVIKSPIKTVNPY